MFYVNKVDVIVIFPGVDIGVAVYYRYTEVSTSFFLSDVTILIKQHQKENRLKSTFAIKGKIFFRTLSLASPTQPLQGCYSPNVEKFS